MSIIGIVAAGVCICVMILTVKGSRSDMGHVISIAATVFFAIAVIPYITEIVSSVQEFAKLSKTGEKFMVPVLKITGIAYICQIGTDLCRDCGENSIATRIEAAGKLGITVMMLPLAKDAFSKIMEILL